MKARKIQDLNRYLIHTRFLKFNIIRVENRLFAVDPEGISIDNFIDALFQKQPPFALESLEKFIKSFQISPNHIYEIDKEMMNRVGYAIKKLEYWNYRQEVDEVFPGKSNVINDQNLDLWRQLYDQWKSWLTIARNYSDSQEKMDFLIPDDVWRNAWGQMWQSSFPEEFYPYLRILFWYSKVENIHISIDSITSAYDFFIKKYQPKDYIGKKITGLQYVLGYHSRLPKGLNEDKLNFIREKILGKSYVQNISMIKRLIIRDILEEPIEEFDRWMDLIVRKESAFKALERILNEERKSSEIKGIRKFVQKTIALQCRKKGYKYSKKLIHRIDGVIHFSHIKELMKIEKEEEFSNYILRYQHKEANDVKREVALINKGYSSDYLLALKRGKVSLYTVESYPQIIPLLAEYVKLVESLPIPKQEIKKMLDNIDEDDFIHFQKKKGHKVESFVAVIQKITRDLFQENDPYLKTFLTEIPKLIFSISKEQTNELIRWQKPAKRIYFSKEIDLPIYLKFLRSDLEKLAYHRQKIGEIPFPKSILSLFKQNEKLERQIAFLEKKLETETENEELKERLKNLNDQFLRFEEIHLSQVKKKIHNSLKEAKIASLKRIINDITREQLEKIIPHPDRLIEENSIKYLFPFIRFLTFTGEKRRLINLLDAYIKEGESYKLSFVPNQKWLEQASKRGVNIEAWNRPYHKKTDFEGDTITFYESTNPVEIFMMGYFFNTCLSIENGSNRDSVVKNATDINKKVLYAKNSAGHIIGRKLIGVSNNFRLLGFYSYFTGGQDQQNSVKAFGLLFDQFCFELAEKANLPLGNSGTVPELNEGFWYFDGLVNFDNQFFQKEGEISSNDRDISTPHPAFSAHPYFWQYYHHHKEIADKICQSLAIEPLRIGGKASNDDFEMLVELGIRIAAQKKDRDFLNFAVEHSPEDLKLDAVLEWALLTGDKVIPLLKDYCKHSEEAAYILWRMNTPDSLREFYSQFLKFDWGIFALENGFVELCDREDLTMQKKIVQMLLGIQRQVDLTSASFYCIDRLHPDILNKNLFKLLEKMLKVFPPSFRYFEDIANIFYTILGNVILPESEKMELSARQINMLADIPNPFSHKDAIPPRKMVEGFLLLHPHKSSTAYFKKQVNSKEEFSINPAVFYLCFHKYHSRHLTENLLKLLPDPLALTAILITKNDKLIQKAIKQMRTNQTWNEDHDWVMGLMNCLNNDDLEGLKAFYKKEYAAKDLYALYLVDYFRRKGFDGSLVRLILEWKDEEKSRHFCNRMFNQLFYFIPKKEDQLEILKILHPHHKADKLFDVLLTANLEDVKMLRQNFTEKSVHLNPNWHLYKQQKINPKYIKILRPLFFNSYWDFQSFGDFEREKEYLANYPIRSDVYENMTPLRKKIIRFQLE